jgi:endonuclease YncB( thermonuclease family)
MRFVLFLLITLFSTSFAKAELYSFKVLRVVDGDTVQIDAPFLPKELHQTILIRIHGVDTPEKGKRAKCDYEDKLSQQAKLFVELELRNAKNVLVQLKSWDKYGGRVLGDLIIDGIPLSKKLVAQNYAVPYFGKGKKKDWCQLSFKGF